MRGNEPDPLVLKRPMHTKWGEGFSMRYESAGLLEEKREELHDTGLARGGLDMTSEAQDVETKMDRWFGIQREGLCTAKDSDEAACRMGENHLIRGRCPNM